MVSVRVGRMCLWGESGDVSVGGDSENVSGCASWNGLVARMGMFAIE